MGDRSADSNQTYTYYSVSYQQATHQTYNRHGYELPSGYGPLTLLSSCGKKTYRHTQEYHVVLLDRFQRHIKSYIALMIHSSLQGHILICCIYDQKSIQIINQILFYKHYSL